MIRISRRSTPTLILLAILLCWPTGIRAQGTSDLLADALAQIRTRNLDSAIALLQSVTSSPADSSARAEAFLWLGVARFYRGQDSVAREAFRDALRMNPLLIAAGRLTRLDSTMAAVWEREQTQAICGEILPGWFWPSNPSSPGDPLNASARGLHIPEITSGPSLYYPDNLRQGGIQGRVLVRAIVDTLGRPEAASLHILWTSHPDFVRPVMGYMERARFRPAAGSAGPVRSCVVIPVDFRIAR